MKGSEKIGKFENDVREIKAHLKLAGEKLDKLAANHDISTRMEEDIVLLISGEVERLLNEEIGGLVENFKYYLESRGEIDIEDDGEIIDIDDEAEFGDFDDDEI